jgi:hypothetical protein
LQNLVQWGQRVVVYPPYSPLLSCDYCLFACVKEHLCGKRFELEHNFSTAVTAYLYRLSKDEYRAAIDHLPCRWEECVNSAGVCIE